MGGTARLSLAVALLAARSAAADPLAAPDLALRPPDEGPFLGDRYRWAEMNVLQRVAFDLVAIPAGVPRWDAGDWARFAAVTGTVAALMAPAGPSPDVQLDRWIGAHVNPSVPEVWTPWMQPALWGGIAAGGLGTWAWAAWTGHDEVAQGISLMGESLAVAQAYHLTLKILIGRDGPRDGDRTGRVLGPTNAFRVYPGGTPSGHAATLYSLLVAGLAYFEPPGWVRLAAHGAAAGLVAFHVIDHRHYLSETIAGVALGWSVGDWVVAHRRSPVASAQAPALSVAPLAVPGGAGVALAATF